MQDAQSMLAVPAARLHRACEVCASVSHTQGQHQMFALHWQPMTRAAPSLTSFLPEEEWKGR
jgi:hypothetical protein